MAVCAIDVGSGFTKYAWREEGGKVKSDKFPSVVHANITHHRGGTQKAVDSLDIADVMVGGDKMTVGKDIMLVGKHTARELHSDYSQTPDYEALMMGALHYLGYSEISTLVLGLPVSNLHLANALAKRWKGEHKIAKEKIQVHEVVVIPQTIGGMLYKNYLDKQSPNAKQNSLIIDPGYLTVDWVVAKGQKTNNDRSDSHYESMRACLKAMAAYVSQEAKTVFNDYDRLDECRMENKPLRIGRKTYEARHYEKAADPVVDRAMKLMMESIGSIDDIDHVYIVGGGADLYKRGLSRLMKKRKLANIPVSIVPGSQVANVCGYLLLGEQVEIVRKRKCA